MKEGTNKPSTNIHQVPYGYNMPAGNKEKGLGGWVRQKINNLKANEQDIFRLLYVIQKE